MTTANGAVVNVEGLTKDFGHTRALDAVTFDVPRQSIFGLLGPNGAGKTTLFSIVANFMWATEGRVHVMGIDVREISRLRGRLAILPQDALFQKNLPIMEQLVIFRRLAGSTRHDAEREVREALQMVGLGDYLKQGVGALSHGMVKRLGVAQAFLGSPEVILLDEPTSGLDPANAKQVRDLVRELRVRTTVVISSHNLAEIQELCDHVAILDRGKLVASGSVDSLTRGRKELDLELPRALGDAEREAIAALPGVAKVVDRGPGRYTVSLAGDESAIASETAIAGVLLYLLDAGIVPRAFREGATLEARFLEMTGIQKGDAPPVT